jgi:hypothetical protein
MHMNLPQGFGVLWHSSTSTHLPLEPDSKPRGQFVLEAVGAKDIGLVVVIIMVLAVVVGDARGCGVGTRGTRSQR